MRQVPLTANPLTLKDRAETHLPFDPHTHWDREWYLTRGQFGARLIRMVDQLVELLAPSPGSPGFCWMGRRCCWRTTSGSGLTGSR
jgi:hypothetical protein